jgi:hypothetical protein
MSTNQQVANSRSAKGWFAAGLALGLAVAVGAVVESVAMRGGSSESEFAFPQTGLKAVATHSTDSVAMATGMIEENEGLFTLDYLTGDLQCFVIYTKNVPRPYVGAVYKYNVLKDLEVNTEKKASYLMLTGVSNLVRGASNVRPSQSVVYVMNVENGRFAAYAVPWDATLASRGQQQTGPLLPIDGGVARTATVRPQ